MIRRWGRSRALGTGLTSLFRLLPLCSCAVTSSLAYPAFTAHLHQRQSVSHPALPTLAQLLEVGQAATEAGPDGLGPTPAPLRCRWQGYLAGASLSEVPAISGTGLCSLYIHSAHPFRDWHRGAQDPCETNGGISR